MPASTQPTWRNSPCSRVVRVGERVAGREVRIVDHLGHRRDGGHARVGRTERRDPVVAVARRERGAEVGADLVLHRVVVLVLDPLLAAERAAQVGVEVRLDRADREPLRRRGRGRRRNRRSGR